MTVPLPDCRVVDLTDLRGAMCGRMLADFGADVVQVTGHQPPVHPSLRTAAAFRSGGRAIIELDLEGAAGLGRLEALLRRADVVVENLSPDQRRRFGLDPGSVADRHPHLVHVALADFGLEGPRSGWRLDPLTAQAAGGTLFASGFPDRPPCWFPGFLGFDCASIYGLVGAVTALADRDRYGRGQTVEVSVQEAVLDGTNPWSVAINDYLKINPFLPARGTRNGDGFYWVLPAADGWVRTVIGNQKQWEGFVALAGHPEALAGPEWHEPLFRRMNADVARIVAGDRLADRTRAELFEQARRLGATLGILHQPREYIVHPHTVERSVFVPSRLPGLEEGPEARPPMRFSATPVRDATQPAAAARPEWSERMTRIGEPGAEPALLLEGVRVIEFGMAAVGPEVSLVLSGLGADVIKIESSIHLDVLRQSGFDRINCGFAFNTECRGRRSVTLNLSDDRGRQLAFDLCAAADVVVENFRGGALDAIGLGYEAVAAANPTVIYASSSGYGRPGPLAEMPAYGPLNLGFVGLHHLWNFPDSPYPCGTSLNHPDHVAGKYIAAGVIAALEHRRRTGEGQHIELAQTDLAAYLRGEVYLEAWRDAADPVAMGDRAPYASPHGVYPTAGDDTWIAISVDNDECWQQLCQLAGWDGDARLDELEGRLAAADALDQRLAVWTASQDATELAARLQDAGVCASPVMGPLDQLEDAHLLSRGAIVELQHPEVGSERYAANPVRMSLSAQRVAPSAPLLGQHTVEVLTEVLGLDAAEVDRLIADGTCV